MPEACDPLCAPSIVDLGPQHLHTLRFGSTANVLAKCKLKYYRISEGHTAQNLLGTVQMDCVEVDAVDHSAIASSAV